MELWSPDCFLLASWLMSPANRVGTPAPRLSSACYAVDVPADSWLTYPSRTSSRTAAGSRSAGSPYPPPHGDDQAEPVSRSSLAIRELRRQLELAVAPAVEEHRARRPVLAAEDPRRGPHGAVALERAAGVVEELDLAHAAEAAAPLPGAGADPRAARTA